MRRLPPTVVALVATLIFAAPAAAASPDVVISQLYGAGGNSGALAANDYVELFNRGPDPAAVDGWSIQYASAAGTSWTNKVDLSGTIAPGGHYLIALSGGTTGAPLPTPDATGGILMSATNGKVALVTSTTPLTACGTDCSALPQVRDFAGYGTADDFEGTGAIPALDAQNAGFRAEGGCQDTDDNAADFTRAAPAPRNAASPAVPCTGPQPPVAACGGPLAVIAGDAATRAVSATDPDGRVTGLALAGAAPGIALGDVVPAGADGRARHRHRDRRRRGRARDVRHHADRDRRGRRDRQLHADDHRRGVRRDPDRGDPGQRLREPADRSDAQHRGRRHRPRRRDRPVDLRAVPRGSRPLRPGRGRRRRRHLGRHLRRRDPRPGHDRGLPDRHPRAGHRRRAREVQPDDPRHERQRGGDRRPRAGGRAGARDARPGARQGADRRRGRPLVLRALRGDARPRRRGHRELRRDEQVRRAVPHARARAGPRVPHRRRAGPDRGRLRRRRGQPADPVPRSGRVDDDDPRRPVRPRQRPRRADVLRLLELPGGPAAGRRPHGRPDARPGVSVRRALAVRARRAADRLVQRRELLRAGRRARRRDRHRRRLRREARPDRRRDRPAARAARRRRGPGGRRAGDPAGRRRGARRLHRLPARGQRRARDRRRVPRQGHRGRLEPAPVGQGADRGRRQHLLGHPRPAVRPAAALDRRRARRA